MTTSKQLVANRQNALKSTGPKTQRGKDCSRLNALRHGAFAENLVLLPGEDPQDIAALRRAYRELYRPANQTEHFLVDRMILAAWRLMRLTALEPRILQVHREIGESNALRTQEILGLFRQVIPRGNFDDPIAHAYIRDSKKGNAISKLTHTQIAMERSFYSALHQLRVLRGQS